MINVRWAVANKIEKKEIWQSKKEPKQPKC